LIRLASRAAIVPLRAVRDTANIETMIGAMPNDAEPLDITPTLDGIPDINRPVTQPTQVRVARAIHYTQPQGGKKERRRTR